MYKANSELYSNGVKLDTDTEYLAFGDLTYFGTFADFLQNKGYRIKCFCDKNMLTCSRGMYLSGVEIVPLDVFLSNDRKLPVWLFCHGSFIGIQTNQ